MLTLWVATATTISRFRIDKAIPRTQSLNDALEKAQREHEKAVGYSGPGLHISVETCRKVAVAEMDAASSGAAFFTAVMSGGVAPSNCKAYSPSAI